MSERGRETASYVTGYVLALALTGSGFALVRWPSTGASATFAIVLALAFAQMLVHFRCFLDVSLKRSSRHDLALILFSSLVITLMVSGTLVILFNQRARMM